MSKAVREVSPVVAQQSRKESKHDIPKKSGIEQTLSWQTIPWKQLERRVYKLQKRIYQAASSSDTKTVHLLQKTLLKSWSAKCLAVRKVTQDNQGKKTAGIDGIKLLNPHQRLNLVNQLKVNGKASAVRRVWIPKPGTQEKRPLGILTMHDRALQALTKMALEPEWEARFEAHSYGFRPGRSVQDAIAAITSGIKQKAKYVLDADICKCFDKINQSVLLEKIDTFPTLRRQIEAWLKAGIMDGKHLFSSTEGTQQGGVISPLLANIALHGLEELVIKSFPRKDFKVNGKWATIRPPKLIRYCDDFVVIHEDLSIIQKCLQVITEWLKCIGLELKASKTQITHTFTPLKGVVGFDFLGFHIRQYPVGNYRSARQGNGTILGFKTIIQPSKEKFKQHLREIGKIIDTHSHAPQSGLIDKLNPVIRGWANYYSTIPSWDVFSKADFLTYQKLRAWAFARCDKGNKHQAVKNYWRTVGSDNWRFSTPSGYKLVKHSDIKINRYTLVKGNRSPYDGDWIYWSTRMGHHPEAEKRIAFLLKKQKGRCTHCGLYFKDGDLMEVDHIKPRSQGGRDEYKNFQLLHRHCHDVKTRSDGSFSKNSISEEYLEANPF
jgi:RNA-directed DNA polymerase